MLRMIFPVLVGAFAAIVTTTSIEAKGKASTYRGCPSGLTFAPDLLKRISWARGVWGFPGLGYRPPKEWKCK